MPKTMKPKLLFVPLLVLLLAGSCEREKTNQPVGNRREMLTGSTWRIGQYIVDGVITSPECKTDDLWVFSEDGGNGYIDDGADRCTDEENTTFTYSVTGDQRHLYLYYMSNRTTYGTYMSDSYRLDWDFVYMTERELIVRYYYMNCQDGRGHLYDIRMVRLN